MIKTFISALIFSLIFAPSAFAADNCQGYVREAATRFLSEQNPAAPGLIVEIRMVLFHNGYLQFQVEVVKINQAQPEFYIAHANGNERLCQVTQLVLEPSYAPE